MMKLLMKKSKQGITLVESAIAVVLLGFAAAGILSLLISSGSKIFDIGAESYDYAVATQKMDYVISVVSNTPKIYGQNNAARPAGLDIGELDLYSLNGNLNGGKWTFDSGDLKSCTIVATTEFYGNYNDFVEKNNNAIANDAEELPEIGTYIRGWHLTLTYGKITVTSFVSNSEGGFDN